MAPAEKRWGPPREAAGSWAPGMEQPYTRHGTEDTRENGREVHMWPSSQVCLSDSSSGIKCGWSKTVVRSQWSGVVFPHGYPGLLAISVEKISLLSLNHVGAFIVNRSIVYGGPRVPLLCLDGLMPGPPCLTPAAS